MSRINDRERVIVPEREELPRAIADRRDKYTHAYPEGFRMDRGSVKIFGPRQAPRPQAVAMLDTSAQATRERELARQQAMARVELEMQVVEEESAVERSWADEEQDEELEQHVLVYQG